MKKVFFLFASLLLLFGCILQKEHFDTVRKDPKLKVETPPGCTWLRDSTFIDMTEIRNMDYLEFLYWIDHHEPEKIKTLLPDTLVWRHKLAYSEPYVEYYFRHPAYRNFPVVGVSYEQAVEYCKWRSKMVNRFIYIRDQKLKTKNYSDWDTITHAPEIMRFRLPTKEEWEYAAAAGLNENYPYGYERLTDSKNLPVSYTYEYYQLFVGGCNYYIGKPLYSAYTPDLEPGTVYFGKPNKYGIWNLSGNVSELTADTLVKGYNYRTSLDGMYHGEDSSFVATGPKPETRAYYQRDYCYKGPQAWLGFRCVCDVLK